MNMLNMFVEKKNKSIYRAADDSDVYVILISLFGKK